MRYLAFHPGEGLTGRAASAWQVFGGLSGLVALVFGFSVFMALRLVKELRAAAARELEIQTDLLGARNFLQSIIDSLPDEVMVLSPTHEILLANHRC